MIYLTFYFSNFSPSRPTAALFSFACKKPRKFFQRLAPLFFRLRPSDALAFSSAPVRASRSEARPSPLFWLSVSPESGVCNPFSLSSRNIFSCSRGLSTGHCSLFSHGRGRVWGALLSGGCRRPPSCRRAHENRRRQKGPAESTLSAGPYLNFADSQTGLWRRLTGKPRGLPCLWVCPHHIIGVFRDKPFRFSFFF